MKVDQSLIYGLYYDANEKRIDQGVNEVVDTNEAYYGENKMWSIYLNIKESNPINPQNYFLLVYSLSSCFDCGVFQNIRL